ncbi:hypothetical protein [Streptomyces roseicoloratus]|uniref:hypothetical protein n=1 Tax=Streptomyces roseicoloratus TaxID=2508722 RepID=UPI0035A60D48
MRMRLCRYPRSLYPAGVRIAVVRDDFSPHLTTKRCRRVADRTEANNVEITYTPNEESGSAAPVPARGAGTA